MRIVIQRVSFAEVVVDEVVVGRIDAGFLALVGAEEGDASADAAYCAEKTAGLRVFTDADGKMNLGLKDVNGKVLAVSQFTLLGDTRRGRRPSFVRAARPEAAKLLFDEYVQRVKQFDVPVETGTFQAHMQVSLNNDGPVTILLDSRRLA
ncbi:MAG: D-tyrosyl-tRNA(Tyr) deacylase [Oscillospiraceae bacterium]|jgi:D-tyrosyl-tRNA(Tyr) deacylase|nr:D-tyrosyl-tRNA(Tyr) deacylase [Oscillospiraceae bacterium]